MSFVRLHKKHDFTLWLLENQPATLPTTYGAILRHFIGIQPRLFSALLVATVISFSMLLAVPYVIKIIIDRIATAPEAMADPIGYIMPAFLLLLGMMLVRFFLQYAVWMLSYQWMGPNFGMIAYTVMSYVQQHQHSYFENELSGRIIQKATTLYQSVQSMVNTVLWNLAPAAAYFAVTLVMLGLVSPWLAGFGVLWFITVFTGAYFVGRTIPAAARKMNETKSQGTGHFADVVTNIRNVIHFGREREETVKLATLGNITMNTYRYWYLHILNVRLFNQLMIATGIIGLIGSSIYLWSIGMASPGDIALVGTLTLLIMQRALDLAESLPDILDNFGIVQDSLNTLVKPHQIVDDPQAKPLQADKGAIDFSDVTYRYVADTDVFKNFELHIKPGERIGLVGTSGAGKTTLVHLLLRLYDVQEGTISIDGQNIKDVTQSSLRRNIAFIPQDVVLFHRSVRENIRYGNPDATDEQVEAAARAAQAHGFISTFPKGYDTMVGERGVRLSGGQRQRVAIARALLKEAPILILDEATSALDSEAEAEIQTAIQQAMKGKTVIAIAHRLSTISSLDRLVVLEDGKISEQGTHAELLAKGGLYARLWARQSGGFLGLDAAE